MRRGRGEPSDSVRFVIIDGPCIPGTVQGHPMGELTTGRKLCLRSAHPRDECRAVILQDPHVVPVFQLASACCSTRDKHVPDLGRLLLRRPVAVIAVIPKPAVLFTAGAIAGAIGKTVTAPLDRVKLLMQTGGGLEQGVLKEASSGGNVWRAFLTVGRQGGLSAYWKGNFPQVLRVLPYSAVQLYSYEVFKKVFRREDGSLTIALRLTAGAFAGMAATLVTYPLDTMRLRMAVDPRVHTLKGAAAVLWREGAYPAFFRGLTASLIGIAPYMAIELAAFDLIPHNFLPFARGFTAALLATSCCYPLDTVRRQLQLNSAGNMSMLAAAKQLARQGGLPAFYRGFLPNCAKNLPNKGVKLATFDAAKQLLNVAQTAYEDEAAWQRSQLPLRPA